MASRQLEENIDSKYNRILANHLGITYSEIGEMEWSLDTNESKDGHIYSYLFKFSDSCPNRIIKKVKDIDDNNVVDIEIGEYETKFVDVL